MNNNNVSPSLSSQDVADIDIALNYFASAQSAVGETDWAKRLRELATRIYFTEGS